MEGIMIDLVTGKGILKVEKFRIPTRLSRQEDKIVIQIESGIIEPDDIIITPENAWFTAGYNIILNLITGQSTAFYSNTLAQIGVGNSATAFSDSHTTLQGASTSFKGMVSAYPNTPASGQVSFRSLWGTTEGNFQWEEWAIRESTDSVLWNRGLTGGGASWLKTSAEIWVGTAILGKA